MNNRPKNISTSKARKSASKSILQLKDTACGRIITKTLNIDQQKKIWCFCQLKPDLYVSVANTLLDTSPKSSLVLELVLVFCLSVNTPSTTDGSLVLLISFI